MKSRILDLIGISAATLCLIHCIVFPLLMVIPLGISHNPLIDLVFLIIGIAVVFRITKKIRSVGLRFLFWISVFLIAVSVSMDLLFHFHSRLMYFGAAGLILAHLVHFKKHRH